MVSKNIYIKMPNGMVKPFPIRDFETFGYELEHKIQNICLNLLHPSQSFLYETNSKGEIVNKDFITYRYD